MVENRVECKVSLQASCQMSHGLYFRFGPTQNDSKFEPTNEFFVFDIRELKQRRRRRTRERQKSNRFRPCPQVSVFAWKRNFFFSVLKKKFACTHSVLATFSPVYTNTMNRFENDNLPDCARLTHTCSLSWARAFFEFLWCGFISLWRFSLVSQDNETAVMLVSQTNLLGGGLFPYANTFVYSNKFA